MELLDQIKVKMQEINDKKSLLIKQLREDFPAIFKPLFDKSEGKITSIGWTQYTPYFNDGDECTFGVNLSYPNINGEYIEDRSDLDWRIKYYLKGDSQYPLQPEWDIELYKLVEQFKEVLETIEEDFYKDLFGDHVQVTMHSDGTIETEEYEHD